MTPANPLRWVFSPEANASVRLENMRRRIVAKLTEGLRNDEPLPKLTTRVRRVLDEFRR